MLRARRRPLAWIGLSIGAALLHSSGPRPAQPRPPRPNVVIVMADALGYADIGPHGSTEVSTPNLDRLAREGIRMTRFYASAPICTPTRAALLTGRYPHRMRLDRNVDRRDPARGLPATETTVAERLRDLGYATAMVGKWHLGYRREHMPTSHGFDEFFGLLDISLDYHSHRNRDGDPALYEGTEVVERQGYLTTLLTDRAVDFIERSRQKPFFLFVGYNAVQPPYQVPERPDDVRTLATWHEGSRQDQLRMVGTIDDGVGRILDALQRVEVAGDTIVVFTSDHGGLTPISDNAPFFHGCTTVWEGGIRVPCLLRWPGVFAANTTNDQVAVTMDLTSTVLAAAGTTPPAAPELDGIDLLPFLTGERDPADRELYWAVRYTGRKQLAMRSGRWKYVRDAAADVLFDLEDDPSEHHSVAHRHVDLVNRLRAEALAWEAAMELADDTDRDPWLWRFLITALVALAAVAIYLRVRPRPRTP